MPKTLLPLLSMAAVLLMTANANVFANPQLAQEKNCLNCHQIDKKLIGPPYKQVAAKYRKDREAENRLVKKVLEGSYGTWGQVPMPANQVSEDEARTLVKWVLSLK
jgi:cytochrome c